MKEDGGSDVPSSNRVELASRRRGHWMARKGHVNIPADVSVQRRWLEGRFVSPERSPDVSRIGNTQRSVAKVRPSEGT